MKLSLAILALSLVFGGRAAPSVASPPASAAHAADARASTPAAPRLTLDEEIRALEQKLIADPFQDAPALVRLASLQIQRDGATPAAKSNLHRALAIDDASVAACDALALALRGPLTGSEPDLEARIAAVQSALDGCKRIDANRPDPWFDEGILTQEFRTKSTTDAAATKVVLDRAEKTFRTFLTKADEGALRRRGETRGRASRTSRRCASSSEGLPRRE